MASAMLYIKNVQVWSNNSQHVQYPEMNDNRNLFKSNMIQTNLKMQIIAICTFPVFDSDSMKNDIYGYIGTIKSILGSERGITKEEEDVISEINKLSKVLRLMLIERISLHQELAKLNSFEYVCHKYNEMPYFTEWNTPPSSSIENQDAGVDIKSSPFERKNRISRENLNILEGWYEENVSYPYLTASATNELTSKTKLSSNQVHNW